MRLGPRITESELLKRCQAGDQLAWELFIRRHQQRVFSISGAFARNPEDTRDLAQEIFIKLYRNLSKCSDPDMLIPWMNALARNTAIDFLRRVYRHSPRFEDIANCRIQSSEPSPEDLCMISNRKDLLRTALNTLDLLHREILMLKEFQGLSLNTIAEILHIPIGTAKSRLFNARIKLTRQVTNMCKSEVCDVSI